MLVGVWVKFSLAIQTPLIYCAALRVILQEKEGGGREGGDGPS